MKRFVLVAGESSGDLLGADLILALKKIFPQAEFAGIGGPKMIEAGLKSWFDFSILSVMGISKVLLKFPQLFRMYWQLIRKIKKFRPHYYIGIDASDFNLRVEQKLRSLNQSRKDFVSLKIIHYVSPSIWAWRYHRIFAFKQATDLMLCLFPFEEKRYQEVGHPAAFVGHPLANQIPLGFSHSDQIEARESFHLPLNIPLMAILPGSRAQEVRRLLPVFLEAFRQVKQVLKKAMGILPVAHADLWKEIRPFSEVLKSLGILCVEGRSAEALAACDVALVASGTAALEAVLYKKPTIVAYKTDVLTYLVGRALVRLPFIALPNLLALWEHQVYGLIPEFLQSKVTASHLSQAMLKAWKNLQEDNFEHQDLMNKFENIHRELALNSAKRAVKAIQALC